MVGGEDQRQAPDINPVKARARQRQKDMAWTLPMGAWGGMRARMLTVKGNERGRNGSATLTRRSAPLPHYPSRRGALSATAAAVGRLARLCDAVRILCAVAVVAASMLPVAAGGQHWKSGHYKSATLSWERVGGDKSRTVDITLRASWSTEFSAFQEQVDGGVIQPGQEIRLMGLGNPVLFFGDGAESYAMLNAKVIAVDPVVQAWRGEATVRHTYPAHANYTAHIGGCCRDPHVRNSERGYFQIATGVHLASNGSRSPQLAVLARQYVRAGWLDAHANGFVIAAFDSGVLAVANSARLAIAQRRSIAQRFLVV